MPHTPSTRKSPLHSQSLGDIDKLLDRAFAIPLSPPPVTPIYFPAGSDSASVSWEPFSFSSVKSPDRSKSLGSMTPNDQDKIWADIRHKKELALSKSPAKVKSIQEAGPSLIDFTPHNTPSMPLMKVQPLNEAGPSTGRLEQTTLSQPTVAHPGPGPKQIPRRRKSHATFRESTDGSMVTATFDMPGIRKQDMHVSYQRNKLIVSWHTTTIGHVTEDGEVIRERVEKKYDRIIPLPEGTKFEEVRACADGRHLILSYPNMRTVKVEPREDSREQVQSVTEHW